MSGVQIRLDGTTLVVRIPMQFQRRGGRKRIIAPDGSELAPATRPQPDGTLLKALARAWRWQGMLDEGIYTTVSEIGDAENISKSYVSRILRLALLAPDIVEAILAGRMDQGVMLEQLERPLPANWEEQRRLVSTAAI
jgi:ParB-like chromosome segregation protein Spo0J